MHTFLRHEAPAYQSDIYSSMIAYHRGSSLKLYEVAGSFRLDQPATKCRSWLRQAVINSSQSFALLRPRGRTDVSLSPALYNLGLIRNHCRDLLDFDQATPLIAAIAAFACCIMLLLFDTLGVGLLLFKKGLGFRV